MTRLTRAHAALWILLLATSSAVARDGGSGPYWTSPYDRELAPVPPSSSGVMRYAEPPSYHGRPPEPAGTTIPAAYLQPVPPDLALVPPGPSVPGASDNALSSGQGAANPSGTDAAAGVVPPSGSIWGGTRPTPISVPTDDNIWGGMQAPPHSSAAGASQGTPRDVALAPVTPYAPPSSSPSSDFPSGSSTPSAPPSTAEPPTSQEPWRPLDDEPDPENKSEPRAPSSTTVFLLLTAFGSLGGMFFFGTMAWDYRNRNRQLLAERTKLETAMRRTGRPETAPDKMVGEEADSPRHRPKNRRGI